MMSQVASADTGDISPIKTYHADWNYYAMDRGPYANRASAAVAIVQNFCERGIGSTVLKNCKILSVSEEASHFFFHVEMEYYIERPSEPDDPIGPLTTRLSGRMRAHCAPNYAIYRTPLFISPYENGTLYYPDLICRPTVTPLAKDLGGSCDGNTGVGNPIHAGSANKYQIETDIAAAGASPLAWRRTYNSGGFLNDGNALALANWRVTPQVSRLGSHWRGSYDRSVTPSSYYVAGAYQPAVHLQREDGKALLFRLVDDRYVGDADTVGQLTAVKDTSSTQTGWQYITPGHAKEQYDLGGKLLSIVYRNGISEQLTYSDASTPKDIAHASGLLIRVTDNFGRHLQLTYDDAHRVASVTAPAGGVYRYSYDSAADGKSLANLSSVTYPDHSVRTYLYNERDYTGGSSFLHALTGIVDENGDRFATFRYEKISGRAIATEHAGGAGKVSLQYLNNAGSTLVTDALGSTRTYRFERVDGAARSSDVDQPGGAGCAAASSAITYDAHGNVASRTDFNGNLTTYRYDLSRNLETSRTEAAGTPAARTIGTSWHAVYRLPLAVAEPKKLTTYAYDDKGNRLSRSEQATHDESGAQGLSAQPLGEPRVWHATYNAVGQVLTTSGPRTDIDDTTRYSYDEQGNLRTVTNALDQMVTLDNYDARGRVGRITGANKNSVTDIRYHPRGWITRVTAIDRLGFEPIPPLYVGAEETTDYTYDAVGQIKQVRLPDGSMLHYTYDAAHRLTGVSDNLGNRIGYTLDAMGNRIEEERIDVDGTLSRQTARAYDALNRLQTLTGGMQ